MSKNHGNRPHTRSTARRTDNAADPASGIMFTYDPTDKLAIAMKNAGLIPATYREAKFRNEGLVPDMKENGRDQFYKGTSAPMVSADLLPTPDDLGRLESERHHIRRRLHKLDDEVAETRYALSSAEASEFIRSWLSKPMVLEKPTTSRLDEAMMYYKSSVVRGRLSAERVHRLEPDGYTAQSIAVEHNWLAVIAHTPDFAAGEWRLPFPYCGFEFRVSGIHIVAILHEDDAGISMNILFRTGKRMWGGDARWYWLRLDGPMIANEHELNRDSAEGRRRWHTLVTLLADNIKACAIMLDAKVAETVPIRVPHRSNMEHTASVIPLPKLSFHTLSLAKRTHTAPLPPGETSGRTHRSPRLHFRRGHYRHYATYKIWINWQLVGNPDLGIIEKDYRL